MTDSADKPVPITVHVPADLRKRATAIFKKHRTSLSHLVREGFRAEIERIEAADKAVADRKKQELEDRRRKTGLRGIGESLLGPAKMAAPVFETRPTLQHIPPIYLKHARLILGALGDRDRVEALVVDAQRDVRAQSPLSPPNDHEIARQLDSAIADLQRQIRIEAMTAPKVASASPFENLMQRLSGAVDDMLGKKIDPSKVKSYGDVVEGEEDVDGNEQQMQPHQEEQ